MKKKPNSYLRRIQSYFPSVVRMIDADAPVRITVTPDEAKNSARKQPSHCAMAKACQRALGLEGVIISLSTAYLVKNRTAVRFMVPPDLRKQVVRFDRGGKFAPGEYTLNHVRPSRTLETMSKDRKNRDYGRRTGYGIKKALHKLENVRKFPAQPHIGA